MPSLKTLNAARTADDLTCYLSVLRLCNQQHSQLNRTNIRYKKKGGVEILRGTRFSNECWNVIKVFVGENLK
jgi:hypothetical protein